MTSTFSIKTYEFKKNIPAYKASIVDLTLASIASLNNIDETTKFGGEFHRLAGKQIQGFLDLLCQLYENCNIADPHSVDYRTSYNFWFLETSLKRRVKYAELHLDNAIHKLNLLLNILIIQLRNRLELLNKVHLSSEFSDSLILGLGGVLAYLPAPLQKDIVITDRREQVDEDGTLPIKTITITYEPFIEHVNASFNEASKLKRMSIVEDKTKEKVPKKIEFHEVKIEKKQKPKAEIDDDGWITKKGKK